MSAHLYTVCVQSVNSFAGWERARGEERDRMWVKGRKRADEGSSGPRPQLVETSHLHLCNYGAVIYAPISTALTKALRGIIEKLVARLTLITHQLLPQTSYTFKTSLVKIRQKYKLKRTHARTDNKSGIKQCVFQSSAPHTNCASCERECDTLVQLENSGLNAHLAKPQRKRVCVWGIERLLDHNRTSEFCSVTVKSTRV